MAAHFCGVILPQIRRLGGTMILDAEMLQAEALLMMFGAGAAHRASDCAHSEAMKLREESAASWRRVTAFILASPHHTPQLTAA
jgi:hypothetical protein